MLKLISNWYIHFSHQVPSYHCHLLRQHWKTMQRMVCFFAFFVSSSWILWVIHNSLQSWKIRTNWECSLQQTLYGTPYTAISIYVVGSKLQVYLRNYSLRSHIPLWSCLVGLRLWSGNVNWNSCILHQQWITLSTYPSDFSCAANCFSCSLTKSSRLAFISSKVTRPKN